MQSGNMDFWKTPPRRAAIAEIAKLAGVGTATVDRVLNNRGGVRETTRQRVVQARTAIEMGTVPEGRKRPWRLKVILPGFAGASTEYLARCFQDIGSRGNATIECTFTRKMEPALLARKLNACSGQGLDAVAFQPLDDPRVQDAVNNLHNLKIPTLALLSGLANRNLIGLIGMDNHAAGRTAGYLMGRLTRQRGTIAVVTGGRLYRVHEDRERGFRAAAAQGFPHIEDTIVLNGRDESETNYLAVRDALRRHPELVGIYNVGGASEGIARAMTEADVKDEIIFIGHNLSERTKRYLLNGTMDVVLHLNMHDVAANAVESLIAHLENRPHAPRVLPTSVVTRENIVGMSVA